MSVVNNNLLLTADAAVSSYQVQRSLRFNSADSAYLNRTPTVAGNRKTWTWAAWVKRSNLSGVVTLFSAGTTATGGNVVTLQLSASGGTSGGDVLLAFFEPGFHTSTQVFRDSSAWFHLVWAVDTTQATAANRSIFYVNGVLASATGTFPPLNAQHAVNSTEAHNIGRYAYDNTRLFDGYLADVHFIDGQALTPSSFTETNGNTGQLVPKAYSGTYGVNGFRLNFSDNSAATAATLGADSSGNGNNWTPNNLSVTAGAGNDSLTDTPTSYGTDTGAGGEVRGNYATLNPLQTSNTPTLSNGNLDTNTSSATTWRNTQATFGLSSGKWYWESTMSGGPQYYMLGVCVESKISSQYGSENGIWMYDGRAFKIGEGNSTSYGATYTSGDVIGVALDLTAGTISFYKNGVSQGTAFSTGLSGVTVFPQFGVYFFSSGNTQSVNFGQRPFAYAAPSGFKALCDTNLPTPTIAKGSAAFNTVLYTGTGAALTPTSSLAFSPDLVWIKGRSGATDHALYDTVRGATFDLVSNSTAAETTQTQGLTAFNGNGFSVGTLAKLNTSAATYAGWCWDAGSSTVTNTAGTITSQVRANASAGFSVVTYSAQASGTATIGHGLGIAPSLIFIKSRVAAYDWAVYHASLGNTTAIRLNLTGAADTFSGWWNNTSPSSTVFTTGSNYAGAGNTVAYCFAPVTGYSSFGSYTGNGSADGPFVYLGFRPAFLMMKRTNSTGNWVMLDSKRKGYNVDNDPLYANLTNAEGTDDLADITSNGFKLRSTNADCNASGGTYIYAAFAENPFQFARAR